MEQASVFLLQYRLELIDVSDKEHLLSSEWLAHVTAVYPKHLVDEVDDVCPHHTYLVDDDEFYLAQQFAVLAVVFECLADVARAVSCIVGEQRMEWKPEKTVQRASSGVYGCDAGRCEYDMFLLGVISHIP